MNATDLASVLELMAAALRQMRDVTPTIPHAAACGATSSRTLSDWLDIHEAQILDKGYKDRTIRNRTSNLRHVRRLWGARPIAEIKAHEIISKIRSEFIPAKLPTAQRVLAEMRDAYVEAIANNLVDTNPAMHVKLPTARVQRKRLSFDSWLRMREAAKGSTSPWFENLLLLALVTGQRRGDLVKTRFEDIKDGHLHVVQQKEAGKGYGAHVAIPLALRMDAVGMSVGAVVDLCAGCGKQGPTLLRKPSGHALEESSLSVRFGESIRAVCAETPYENGEWPSLHEVRSLSARAYLAQGMSRESVQTLLGHKHAEMTALYTDDRGLSAKEFKRVALGLP